MQYFVENDIFSKNIAKILPKIVVNVSENQKVLNINFGEFFFLGKCLVMLSMTSMTASYATADVSSECTQIGHCRSINF